MNTSKRTLAILIVIFLIILGVPSFYWLTHNRQDVSLPDATATTPVSHTANTLHVPAPIFSITADKGVTRKVFTSQTTSSKISFSESGQASRNPIYNISLNGKVIGNFAGTIKDNPVFSPNSAYLSFGSYTACGAGCGDFKITLVDLNNSKIISIKPPFASSNGVNPVIDSYVWNDKDSIDVTAYEVVIDETNEYGFSRTSSKEIWKYDLSKGSYSFVKVIPE
ncbi:MAG: hypothetical protein JWN64_300 [Parcubacteria group bacterium]|nr:hypothetical protein [Parcubacteria group bacterium]